MSGAAQRHAAAAWAVVLRDARLTVRRPSRVVATVMTPALLWAFFAGGFGSALRPAGDDGGSAYTVSLAGGSALLVVTFAAIFGALGLIRDRESGFLQAALVGPTPRWVVIAARVASGALFAWAQALPVLAAAVVFGEGVSAAGLAAAAGWSLAAALGMSGACTALAWRFDSVEGFHGVMSGLLMPAWLLSGAVFPPGEALGGPASGAGGVAAGVLAAAMAVNPLAYAHGAVSSALLGAGGASGAVVNGAVTAAFAAGGVIAAIAAARGDARR